MVNPRFRFTHRLRVRWSEADMQGIVFNGHYLNYFDVAFTEYWRATGLPGPLVQAAEGYELFARKSSIEYHAPARFDDELDIQVRCARLGRTSLTFEIEIHRAEAAEAGAVGALEHLISGELIYVYAHAKERRAEPVPPVWRSTLIAFEATPPDT